MRYKKSIVRRYYDMRDKIDNTKFEDMDLLDFYNYQRELNNDMREIVNLLIKEERIVKREVE